MTTIIENLTQLMTTTPDEDKQFLNEVIQELKLKRPRGRPSGTKKFTEEEALERRREKDKRIYWSNPEKKRELMRKYRQAIKELI